MKVELGVAQAQGYRNREHSRNEAAKERDYARAEAAKDRQHTADESQKERLMDARKVVYMKLIDDFAETVDLFASLPNIDIVAKPDFAHKLMDLGASTNKTWLVSEVETVVKARELQAKLSELFVRLMKRVPPMQALKNRLKRSERATAPRLSGIGCWLPCTKTRA
jgi:hypothetical protein